ncbi:MAG: sulfatase-like hydrolase/transferase [Puniceicoccales bacterium]
MAHEEITSIGYDNLLLSNPIPDAVEAPQAAINFLQKRNRQQPFFLDVGVFETHRYQNGLFHKEKIQGDGRYTRPPEPIPDTPDTRDDWADYCESARRMDQGFGRIRQELEAQGILDDTIIIYTTDHGPAFPNMKCTLSDFGIQVALIMRWPEMIEAGQVSDDLVSHTDLFPSLCDMLGVSTPSWVQGKPCVPALNGSCGSREYVFAEVNHHAVYNPMRCIRSDRYKLVRHYANRPGITLKCCDPGLTKQAFLNWDWQHWHYSDIELYDLYLDPTESNNLAGNELYAQREKEMEAHLNQWMRATDDPLVAVESEIIMSGANGRV